MKATWVFLLAVGVVSADVGLGYHYKVPQTSYGVPSYQFGSSNSGQYSSAYAGSQGGYQGHQNSGYQTGSSHSGSGSGYNYQSSGSNSGVNYVKPNYQTGYNTQYDSSSQYQASAVNKYQQYYQVQQQPAQIFKHFYVHAAPEEREEVKVRKPIVLPPPQKHYKIIFVKAPSEASAPQVIAPVQPQNEEKTIVYVLVKKPDEQPEVVLPKIEQKPPSKPEVYFIKYKNKEDSQAVINNIVKDYNQGHSVSLNSGSAEGSYQSPVAQYPHHSSSGGSFSSLGSNSQAFGLSTASSSSGSGLEESNISSSISSPVTVSSTASSAGYEGAISTSQGVPHETYGPPKFRVN